MWILNNTSFAVWLHHSPTLSHTHTQRTQRTVVEQMYREEWAVAGPTLTGVFRTEYCKMAKKSNIILVMVATSHYIEIERRVNEHIFICVMYTVRREPMVSPCVCMEDIMGPFIVPVSPIIMSRSLWLRTKTAHNLTVLCLVITTLWARESVCVLMVYVG